ncbi:I78 family peptidase inhibitor [Sphingomonas canadensis]|uniref:I78 family peptidase inhibitor n=1 Tax=Sphingomonas canadensis TaxID=1219257 RepID=A0ABW3H9W4_9SPHN|nr:I78 family peptidase inhibitor [Sphingomonas canadensis]MCW3837965.1 I78 family peptidase inhibitor [Sphingomonas canadensis]
MIRILLPAAALFATAACIPQSQPPAPQPAPAPASGTCNADGVRDLIGKPLTEAVAKEIVARTGSVSMRRIAPGMAVTMDYREDRVNAYVDDANVLTDIRCG